MFPVVSARIFGHDILYKATHNLVSLNGSVLPGKCVVRTTRYTSTVMKFVPKECKTATYRKTLFHQNLSDFERLSQYH